MPSSGLAWVKLALLYLESEVEMIEMAKIVEITEMVEMIEMVGMIELGVERVRVELVGGGGGWVYSGTDLQLLCKHSDTELQLYYP